MPMLIDGLLIGLAAGIAWLLARSFFRVEQGELAVLTRWGAALRQAGDDAAPIRTFGPGLHMKLPWDEVHRVPVMERSVDLSGEDGGRTAMAEDGTLLRFDSILRYQPVETELGAFLFGLRRPIEHVTGLFTCLLRNEIANFRKGPGESPAPQGDAGSYALIRSERKALNERIEAFAQRRIGPTYGIRFNAVDLTDILPPDELADALNTVIQARAEAEGQYARAEADCQQRLLAAERGVEIATARAKASEIEIDTLATYLAQLDQQGTLDLYVSRRRAEVTSEARAVYLKRAS